MSESEAAPRTRKQPTLARRRDVTRQHVYCTAHLAIGENMQCLKIVPPKFRLQLSTYNLRKVALEHHIWQSTDTPDRVEHVYKIV